MGLLGGPLSASTGCGFFVPWQGVAVATTIVIITFQMCIYPSDVYLDPLLSVIARARIRLTTYSYVCIRTNDRSIELALLFGSSVNR